MIDSFLGESKFTAEQLDQPEPRDDLFLNSTLLARGRLTVAFVAGVQYLLTLNCRHIASAHELPRVYRLLDDHGFGQLLICTPAEFLGGDDVDE